MILKSFPDACKTTKGKPLYIKVSKTDSLNYRPISLLPLLSKALEIIVLDQTNDYLSNKKILYNYKSGFTRTTQQIHVLFFLNSKILKGFGDGLLTVIILVNLQKAFDTINHEILLRN